MFLLAPLQGYTEVEFRSAWSEVYSGIDLAVSPFIPLAEGLRFREKHLRDVLPENNKHIPVIPQVLGNDPVKFVNLANRLKDLGYETINWNLGCPKRTVARKKRGSGMLPYPDLLREILEQLMPQLPIGLSIKTRLGYIASSEFFKLVEVYNDFPIEMLIIHPRTGIQQYEGEMFLNVLDETINEIRHPVVFSGDIKDWQSFFDLTSRFPQIHNWMIGRGVLSNPVLPEILLQKKGAADTENLRLRQIQFHETLYNNIIEKIERPNAVLNRMKDYWSYFSRWFTDSEKIFITLAHQETLDRFMEFAKKILHEQSLSPIEGRSNRQVKIGEER